MMLLCFPRKEEEGCLAHMSPIAFLVILVAACFDALQPFPMIVKCRLAEPYLIKWLWTKDMVVSCNDRAISRLHVYHITHLKSKLSK